MFFLINFFFLKEKVAKRIKNLAGLSLCQFVCEVKLLAPPRVEILRGKIYSEPRRIFAIAKFLSSCKAVRTNKQSIRAYSAFADLKKSVKRYFTSRFRRMFAKHEQTSRAGRGALFWFFFVLSKPINPARIFAFFATFFSKKKVGILHRIL